MLEWIWASRQQHGQNTMHRVYTLRGEAGVPLNVVVNQIKPFFTNRYQGERLFRALQPNASGQFIDLYVVVLNQHKDDIHITILGDEELVNEIFERLESSYPSPKLISVTKLIGIGPRGTNVHDIDLIESKQDLALQEFYPWMEEDMDVFIQNYVENKASVLLLIGPPGTGKSTFIRTMLFRMGRCNIALLDDSALQHHPGATEWVKEQPNDSVVVFEDADLLVGKRDDGNQQMSMLLNMTDGIVRTDTKMIISTNLSSTNKVDEALLRPGRNYAVLEFRELSATEASTAREAAGMGPADFDPDRTYTLAEALSHHSMLDLLNRRTRGIGFFTP